MIIPRAAWITHIMGGFNGKPSYNVRLYNVGPYFNWMRMLRRLFSVLWSILLIKHSGLPCDFMLSCDSMLRDSLMSSLLLSTRDPRCPAPQVYLHATNSAQSRYALLLEVRSKRHRFFAVYVIQSLIVSHHTALRQTSLSMNWLLSFL